MIPAFVWEYKLFLRFIIRASYHLKEALCVFGGSTIQEFTVLWKIHYCMKEYRLFILLFIKQSYMMDLWSTQLFYSEKILISKSK
jgi:hypothetical protein